MSFLVSEFDQTRARGRGAGADDPPDGRLHDSCINPGEPRRFGLSRDRPTGYYMTEIGQ
jgi:hypothetical protein